MSKEIEIPAKGVRGFLLYNPITEKRWLRVSDPEDKSKYTDYYLHIEDLEIEILSGGASLFKSEEKGKSCIDWSSDIIKRD